MPTGVFPIWGRITRVCKKQSQRPFMDKRTLVFVHATLDTTYHVMQVQPQNRTFQVNVYVNTMPFLG